MLREIAAIAQLVEQLICNQQVIGSSPIGGSKKKGFKVFYLESFFCFWGKTLIQ
jgi:hypothetical protein